MATSELTPNLMQAASTGTTSLLVSLPSLESESFQQMLANLAQAFPAQDGLTLMIATPDAAPATEMEGMPRVVGYTPAALSSTPWVLTAADFVNAYELTQQHGAQAVLQLGSGAQSLSVHALRGLAGAVLEEHCDLAVPRYQLPARTGLVNSAILYPLTRALFGPRVRFPLALDLCFSARAIERVATSAQRFTANRQPDALVWPVIETAAASFGIAEIDAGVRTLPQPANQDLNSLLALIAGSLFTEIDTRAAFWQRSRITAATLQPIQHVDPAAVDVQDIQPMIGAFRLAFGNLQEIWSLVLPPQSLLGLKRLSTQPAESFAMADGLWARIVYDFLLAFRLRTINRGHLLGALTPLYLAWVASHVLLTSSGTDPEQHIEAVAIAFETDKPYLVSRWRWPDRFNP